VKQRIGSSNGLHLQFIPISCQDGENVAISGASMPWYQGPSLLRALCTLPAPLRASSPSIPLRLPIQHIFSPKAKGSRILVGTILTGSIAVNDRVALAPTGVEGKVVSIQRAKRDVEHASAGDSIGVRIIGLPEDLRISSGLVVGPAGLHAPLTIVEFEAKIITVARRPHDQAVGYTVMVHVHSAHVPCRLERLIALLDRSGNVVQENPPTLPAAPNARARVVLKPLQLLSAEALKDPFDRLRRFVMRDVRIIAVGVIEKIKLASATGEKGAHR